MTVTTLKEYPTLSEAIQEHTPAENPDQAGTKIVKHFADKFPDATNAVLFVNLDFSSSQFGAWTVMAVGPNQTCKTVEEIAGRHLNDLPSQRQYPVAFVALRGGTK